ncbi:MAG: pyridoxamine 5'-phosphate oxidase family protein [Propionibacteriaceae bacterium]|jgi:nitroimidazol reductase NimA-like FMN-containing flavoprotein (pyridoxamine 5'-phosphate oxidase superfamily)|nr:pyridoxamine 5'-phosphate oxidase family protein [Propionibacteriaceae bacterium]
MSDPGPSLAERLEGGVRVGPNLALTRHPERQSDDPAALAAILDEALVAHVAFVRRGWPVVLPFFHAVGDLRDGHGPQLLLHGSPAAGLFEQAGNNGVDVAVCVSLLDGLVFARSAFGSSAHYRSAVIYGRARLVAPDLLPTALGFLVDHITPGRRQEVRPPLGQEIKQTAVLSLGLTQATVKLAQSYQGESPDDGEDRGVWAGVVPLALRADQPRPSPETQNPEQVPPSVRALVERLNR